jgi:hypothetical protein
MRMTIVVLMAALALANPLPLGAQEEPPAFDETEVPAEMESPPTQEELPSEVADEAPPADEELPPAEEAPPPPEEAPPPAVEIPERIYRLADALKIELNRPDLVLVAIEPREWPDTSLGCPRPGGVYAQVVVPGYAIILSTPDGSRTWELHTAAAGPTAVVNCT